MKFSKILTTAMMSAVLVASSSAFAAEETPWWSMNFNDLTIAEDGSLTNTLNNAYGTSQEGWWTTEEGDLSTIEDGQLKLNTQGTDLTWTPNGDNDTSLITYIDADVTFVGSDTAPTVSETDVHTAVYLKNIVDDTTGEVTSSVLCAWGRPGTTKAEWVELAGVEIEDGETYRLRIMLDGINLSFFIDGTQLTTTTGATKIETAKDGAQGAVDSVSFRGTGSVDNFAASHEAKEELGVASFAAYSVFEDMVEVTDSSFYLGDVYLGDLTLNGETYPIVQAWDYGWDGDGNQLGAISAIKVTSATKTFEVVYVDGAFTENEAISIEATDQGELGTQYIVSLDSSALVADEEYTLEVYYGEYTPSEEPEPEFAPVAVAAIAIDGTTATLTIEGEYTEVKVLFCETLGGEWVEVEATFADGVATVPATTATGFFKVEAK